MDYAAIIGAILQVAGPVVGYFLAQQDKQKVLELLQGARDRYGNIDVPKLTALTAELMPTTELAKLKDDPKYRQQQAEADNALKGIAEGGGLMLSDKAALNAIRNKVARSESAGRESIAADMARRGTLDSGAQLTMQLDNQQDAANRLAEQGENTAGMAQKRAYEAILARSQNAGQGLDRDYRQKSNAASAQDAINRGNADIRNLTNYRNQQLPQQQFDNEFKKAGALEHADTNIGGFFQGRAVDTQNIFAQGGKAAGQGVTAAFGENRYGLGDEPGGFNDSPDNQYKRYRKENGQPWAATPAERDAWMKKNGYS